MRLRVEEKIRLGRTPTFKRWVCQRCHEVEFNSYRKYCDDCKKIVIKGDCKHNDKLKNKF